MFPEYTVPVFCSLLAHVLRVFPGVAAGEHASMLSLGDYHMEVCCDPVGKESTQQFFASMVWRHKEYSDPF